MFKKLGIIYMNKVDINRHKGRNNIIYYNIILVMDFNTPLTLMGRASRWKISKKT